MHAQEGIAKKQMSENEDIDYEKVITEMLTQESIHRAALSVGARIIQPSLVDFLRKIRKVWHLQTLPSGASTDTIRVFRELWQRLAPVFRKVN